MRRSPLKALLALLAVGGLSFGLQEDLHSEEVVITAIKAGSVGLKLPGADSFTTAKVGDTVPVGTWIMTLEDTDATLTFYMTDKATGDENSTLQIGSYTKIKLTSFDVDEQRAKTEVALRTGSMYSKVHRRTEKSNDYRVRTRQVTAAVRGTGHGYSTSTEGTDSFVTEGEVEQTNNSSGEQKSVGQGEKTNEDGESSVDIKVQGSRKKPVFSGGSKSEQSSQQNNGTNQNDPPSSNTESGGGNVGNSIEEENLGEDNPDGGESSGGSGNYQ